MKNASRNSKSQISGCGDGSRASLDQLKCNSCRDNALNHAYVMLNSRESQLGSWSHHWQLSEIISSLCSGLQKKNQQNAVNHLEGYCERDRCCFATSQAPGISPSFTQSWSWDGHSSQARATDIIKGQSCCLCTRKKFKGSDYPAQGGKSWREFTVSRFRKTRMQWISLRNHSLPSAAEWEVGGIGKIKRRSI